MKFALRVAAFALCLIATYSTATLTRGSTPNAPMPLCPPSIPWCSL